MSDIIERGAEAMRQKRRQLIAQPLDRIWPELMRAAIEAMREPDLEMQGAGFDARESDRDITEVYQAMIDAAGSVAS
jgi:hypothetical protein